MPAVIAKNRNFVRTRQGTIEKQEIHFKSTVSRKYLPVEMLRQTGSYQPNSAAVQSIPLLDVQA